MSRAEVSIQGAVNEIVTNALYQAKHFPPEHQGKSITISLKTVLKGIRVTPEHRAYLQSLLKMRGGIQTEISGLIRDNVHVWIDVKQVSLDQAQALLYKEYFGEAPTSGRMLTYL